MMQLQSNAITKALPALSGSALTYNSAKNAFLTSAYTSFAGNTYYKLLRVSDRILVYMSLGEGYSYTFLNGITLFAWDGTKAKIIGQRSWGGYDWRCYSESFVKDQCIDMLQTYLKSEMKMLGESVSEQTLRDFSRQIYEETQRKKIN